MSDVLSVAWLLLIFLIILPFGVLQLFHALYRDGRLPQIVPRRTLEAALREAVEVGIRLMQDERPSGDAAARRAAGWRTNLEEFRRQSGYPAWREHMALVRRNAKRRGR